MAKVGTGRPVAVTANIPGVPTFNVAAFALVMAGAWLGSGEIVSVNA
jgi:hypothetical protein